MRIPGRECRWSTSAASWASFDDLAGTRRTNLGDPGHLYQLLAALENSSYSLGDVLPGKDDLHMVFSRVAVVKCSVIFCTRAAVATCKLRRVVYRAAERSSDWGLFFEQQQQQEHCLQEEFV